MPEQYLRGGEVAALFHVSPRTIARWAREGRLPCIRTMGLHRRYPEARMVELALELGRGELNELDYEEARNDDGHEEVQ